MRKIYYVTILLTILIVSFLGITYSLEYTDNSNISFELIGPSTLYIDVFTDYQEYGVKVLRDNVDISDKVNIDSSSVDTSKLGNYKVKYQFGNEYIYRNVIVIDKVNPTIKLLGGEEVYLLLGGEYHDSGYEVIDNYDKEIREKVVVSGNVDTSNEGEYTLLYMVSDSSGNKSEVSRKIIVKKPEISYEDNTSSRVSYNSYNVWLYDNTVTKNRFLDDGIYLEGFFKEYSSSYKIKLKKRNSMLEYTYNMNGSGNYYNGSLKLDTVNNGLYDVYIIGNSEEKLVNKLDIYTRIIRAKVNNKLVTMTYDDDMVSIDVSDFEYKYDFAIDPGHGGSDTGAGNGIILEKDLNLIISKYEKCRYESMGYKVYMVRYDDSYGEMLGNNRIDNLDRRGITLGYYGSVSRVTYSNHHNAAGSSYTSGFELLVQNTATKEELAPEFNIYNKFMKFYNLSEDRIRMYSRNYDTGEIFNKSNGEIYDYKNYYSVLRIPYELFNVKNIIYEPIYMSNPNDFNWYYGSNNWIRVSEIKIKEYVNYIGGTYKSDNSMCL